MRLQRNIPKFEAVSLHSNWSSLRRKYLSKIPTDVSALSCGPKTWNISGISDAISPARHSQKSSQHVRACAAGDGAICSKNRIIVPYHGDNPNTRNGALTVSIPDYGSCPRLIVWLFYKIVIIIKNKIIIIIIMMMMMMMMILMTIMIIIINILLGSLKLFTKTLHDNYLRHKTINSSNCNKVLKKGSKM